MTVYPDPLLFWCLVIADVILAAVWAVALLRWVR